MIPPKKEPVSLWSRVGTFFTVAGKIVSGLFSLLIILFFALAFFGSSSLQSGNVAIVPLFGEIMVGGSSGIFGSAVASSDDIVSWIDSATRNDDVKAIILDIDSPGGSPVASKRIVDAVKRARIAGKPVVAVIGETGASGAYWVASSADTIFVDELSVTGSIGVVGSYLDFSGFLDDHNVTYQRLVAGDLKDAGSPYKELNSRERSKIQEKINLIYEFFVADVAKNRNMTVKDVKVLADGFIFLGSEAVKNGLADNIGGEKTAEQFIADELQIPVESFRYEKPKGFLQALSGTLNNLGFSVGKGIGSSLNSNDGIVVRT